MFNFAFIFCFRLGCFFLVLFCLFLLYCSLLMASTCYLAAFCWFVCLGSISMLFSSFCPSKTFPIPFQRFSLILLTVNVGTLYQGPQFSAANYPKMCTPVCQILQLTVPNFYISLVSLVNRGLRHSVYQLSLIHI